ncbi:hypothetical protein DRN73_06690 [Candidatus Pacearchaeota archaeon]|nr:MAG: hypothetical protein DRN73_06690 [Candidatus Pacearchaeota archaeon]
MAEKDKIFSSKVKYSGIFSFQDFYRFCYDWLTDEMGLLVIEDKYVEKLSGDSKNIDIEWTGTRKVTDYFKFDVKVKFRIIGLTNVEVVQNNAKVKTNKGSVEVKLSGTLVRDYQGKFEKTYLSKFLRSIYEKWVIPSRVEEYEDKLVGDCDEFLTQVKSYLDLEGKK